MRTAITSEYHQRFAMPININFVGFENALLTFPEKMWSAQMSSSCGKSARKFILSNWIEKARLISSLGECENCDRVCQDSAKFFLTRFPRFFTRQVKTLSGASKTMRNAFVWLINCTSLCWKPHKKKKDSNWSYYDRKRKKFLSTIIFQLEGKLLLDSFAVFWRLFLPKNITTGDH